MFTGTYMISVAGTERFPTPRRPRRRGAVDLARVHRAGAPDAVPVDAAGEPRERSREADRLRILLVEDNPGDVELVRVALAGERADATLVHVERISEAIERARAGACDVVLLDLSLPDSGGLDGMRRLGAEHPELPVVVLTSLEDDRLASKAVAEGAQDYLVKGLIDGALLVKSIRYAIERHHYAESARQLAEERSARLAAEAAITALNASESRFRAVLDQVHDSIVVLDPEGRVASWSKSAQLQMGWSADEILGKRFDRFFPPEDVARGKPGAELLTAERDGHAEDESWRLRKDGSRFLADVGITALRDEQGRLVGFVKVTRDVTGRRRAEQNVEFLGRATHELAQSLDSRAALERVVQMVVPFLADSCCAFVLAEEGASCELVASACADPAKERPALEDDRRSPVGPWPTPEVIEQLRHGEPIFLPELGEPELRAMARSEDHLELLRSLGLRSSIVVPLRSRDGVYGALTFGMTQPERRFDHVDLELAVDLGRRAELAVENARLFEEVQRAVQVR
ncbi:MAG TPA: PAS domain S-box protein, partial [Anaeromyxobacter sp.]